MFCVVNKLNDYVFEVKDTSDGVVEMFTYDDLIKFSNKGIKILGVEGDLVFPYNSKQTPYTGVECLDSGLKPYAWVYIHYDYIKRGRTHSKTTVLKYDKEKNSFSDEYVSGTTMILEDYELHRLSNYDNYKDYGAVLFKGIRTFNVCPELTSRLNKDVISEIKSGSLNIGEIISRNYGRLNELYSIDDKFGVYVRKDLKGGIDNKYFIGTYDLEEYNAEFSQSKFDLCTVTGAYASTTLVNKSGILLSRVLKKNGIFYKVIVNYANIELISLESIYENLSSKSNSDKFKNDAFVNARLEGTRVIVQGCDGVFEYDMNIVFRVYKNITSMESSQTQLKMQLLGTKDRIDINEKGELLDFSCYSDNIFIPSSVNTLKKGSIKLYCNDMTISFGSGIERIESKAIVCQCRKYIVNTDIKDVKVLTQLMRAIEGTSFTFKLKPTDSNFKEVYVTFYSVFGGGGNRKGFSSRLGVDSEDFFTNGVAYKIVKLYEKDIMKHFKWLEKPVEITDIGIKKLPNSINNVSLSKYGSYSRYYNMYFAYYNLVGVMVDYMTEEERESILAKRKQTRDKLDSRENEFYHDVLSYYYINGYKQMY